MNNNNSKKTSIFKKEGFYVALFVCLCIVAVAITVGVRMNKNAGKNKTNEISKQQINKDGKEVAKNTQDEKKVYPYEDYYNALQVKNNTKENKNVASTTDKNISNNKGTTTVAKQNTTAPVAKTNKDIFVKPIDGKILTLHDAVLRGISPNGNQLIFNHDGIDIEAQKGVAVKAAKDGVVKAINKDYNSEGYAVIIDHQNGISTVYASLMKDSIKVKVGDKVTNSTQLGNVSESTVHQKDCYSIADHLHFSVLKDGVEVDPQTYVKGFEVKKVTTNDVKEKTQVK